MRDDTVEHLLPSHLPRRHAASDTDLPAEEPPRPSAVIGFSGLSTDFAEGDVGGREGTVGLDDEPEARRG
jgi:hypothetical protein